MILKKICIKNFRGISGELNLDFSHDTTNEISSLILTGDNGTGKSSIIDAIEMGLQGFYSRLKSINIDTPYVFNMSRSDESIIKIWLEGTDNVIEKRIQLLNEQMLINDKKPHKLFRISPLVLRRSDILRFISTPEQQAQIVFLKYFKTDDDYSDKENEELQPLMQNRQLLKQQRIEAYSILAKQLRINVEEIPLSQQQFEEFVHNKIYRGVSINKGRTNEFMKGGIIIDINPNIKHNIDNIRKLNEQIKAIQKKIKVYVKPLKVTGRETRLIQIQNVLKKAEITLTNSFKEISSCRSFVDNIELSLGDLSEVSLGIRVHLKNGKTCSPNQIFSEANLDLLALLIFLSVLKESVNLGQAKLLILDDVLQSVDASIRMMVTDYIMKDFSDWQLILTVHDRLWRNQLIDVFRRNNHQFIEKEIVNWDFYEGPKIISSHKDISSTLEQAINMGDSSIICSYAGRLLEMICDNLSWRLPISVIRRKEDRYTLSDLWSGTYKILRKSNLSIMTENVDKFIHLRNLVGAHYNEWAQSVSLQESVFFAENVIQLFKNVNCQDCFRWVERVSDHDWIWKCRCGKLKVEKIIQ